MKWLTLLLLITCLYGDTPEPPILSADIEGAQVFNRSLSDLKSQLRQKFEQANGLSRKGASEADFRLVLDEVRSLKGKIKELEEQWRLTSVEEVSGTDEAYALWDVGETTLAQLIMEYGASDFLYVIPQELSGMKISLFSSIPLPHETWSEMIEMILTQNGVGVKKLNPFVKQLYILKLDPSAIEGIVSQEKDLDFFSNHVRLFYVFSPPPEQLRSVQSFFERFSDPKQTVIQSIGSKVAIVSTKETIDKLLGLYHAVWEQSKGKIVRLIALTKISAQEAEKVLKAVFSDPGKGARPTFYPSNADELATLTLPQGLVLIGEGDTVERGEKILADLEAQLEDPGEKIIYWYACKHSNPEDIAEVLDKVYDSLVGSGFEKKGETIAAAPPVPPPVASQEQPNPGQVFPYPDRSTAFNPVLPASVPFIQPGTIDKTQKSSFGNFIVDNKTTSILMVVRREELPKIKTLLKKLDTPKRMVQLDVLLVEKKLRDRKQIGFSLLQFGTNASNKKTNAISFDTSETGYNKGVLSYFFSRQSNGWPAVDMTYNFLMAQEDIRINANPSVLAINQTPATVSIVEEISINNGAIQLDTTAGVTIEQSFTRAQYGITIVLTPTIHLSESDDTPGFVSLQTNLEFDTTQHMVNDRPPVTRRHIENEVRVADGETVILGGLRRKIEEDSREKIPFLGDLPGIGKLFGAAKSTETNTEMFIFITPHIIHDPVDDLRCIRQCEYQMRAGDIPEFLERIDEAKNQERKKMFNQSLKLLFDLY